MDERLFRYINQFAGSSKLLDSLMVLISKRARFVFLLVVVVLLFRRQLVKKWAVSTIVTIGAAYVISFLLKQLFFRPRPFVKGFVHLLPPVPSNKDSSFPSKHTTLAFALAASVFLYHRLAGVFLWLLSILVGISRIWSGQHYPSDIAASALIGNATAYIVNQTEAFWNSLTNRIIYWYKTQRYLTSNLKT